ncbi:MAG TPA: peptidylprolyl isomerase [Acidimicrobiales bacterium]|jgi:peptidyl-prolyl cis-trans isomerase B (cyclophilin B)|nr:peptidylprolyl isomerase [Acidimicrobiales bacterium]
MVRYGVLAVIIVALIFGFALFRSNNNDDSSSASTTTAVTTTTRAVTYGGAPCPPATVSSPLLDFSDSFQKCIDDAKSYTAVFDTTEGEIRVKLDTQLTPITSNNFVTLARWKYYDNTQIFRTDTSIEIIQGGSPHTNSASDQGPGYTIPDEGGKFTYKPGQLVMARTSAPNSAGAQFFFVGGEKASSLDSQGTYVVFGQTDDAGLAVAKAILALNQNDNSGLGGKPSRPVTVRSVTIVES